MAKNNNKFKSSSRFVKILSHKSKKKSTTPIKSDVVETSVTNNVEPESPPSEEVTVNKGNYIPHDELTLPELFQSLIHKDLNQLFYLLDNRLPSYICVKDRQNRY